MNSGYHIAPTQNYATKTYSCNGRSWKMAGMLFT